MRSKLLQKFAHFNLHSKEKLDQTQQHAAQLKQDKTAIKQKRYHRPAHNHAHINDERMCNLSSPSLISEEEILADMRLTFENTDTDTISSKRQQIALHRMFVYMQEDPIPNNLTQKISAKARAKYKNYVNKKEQLHALKNNVDAETSTSTSTSQEGINNDITDAPNSNENSNSNIKFIRKNTTWGQVDNEGRQQPSARQTYKKYMWQQTEPKKLPTLNADEFTALAGLIKANPRRAIDFLTAKSNNARDKSAGAYLTRFDPQLLYCVHDLLHTPQHMHHIPNYAGIETEKREYMYVSVNAADLLAQQNEQNILLPEVKHLIDVYADQFKYEFAYQHGVNFFRNTFKTPIALAFGVMPIKARGFLLKTSYSGIVGTAETSMAAKEFSIGVSRTTQNFISDQSIQANLKWTKKFGETVTERKQAALNLDEFAKNKKEARDKNMQYKLDKKEERKTQRLKKTEGIRQIFGSLQRKNNDNVSQRDSHTSGNLMGSDNNTDNMDYATLNHAPYMPPPTPDAPKSTALTNEDVQPIIIHQRSASLGDLIFLQNDTENNNEDTTAPINSEFEQDENSEIEEKNKNVVIETREANTPDIQKQPSINASKLLRRTTDKMSMMNQKRRSLFESKKPITKEKEEHISTTGVTTEQRIRHITHANKTFVEGIYSSIEADASMDPNSIPIIYNSSGALSFDTMAFSTKNQEESKLAEHYNPANSKVDEKTNGGLMSADKEDDYKSISSISSGNNKETPSFPILEVNNSKHLSKHDKDGSTSISAFTDNQNKPKPKDNKRKSNKAKREPVIS